MFYILYGPIVRACEFGDTLRKPATATVWQKEEFSLFALSLLSHFIPHVLL